MKKTRKNGFTLVELIVVLVILAILAAILVPALTGYIQKAKERNTAAYARRFQNAVQAIASEQYADGSVETTYEAIAKYPGISQPKASNSRIMEIYKLMEVDNVDSNFKAIASVVQGKVTCMRYWDGKSNVLMEWTIESGSWTKIKENVSGDDDSTIVDWNVFINPISNESDKSRVWWNGN